LRSIVLKYKISACYIISIEILLGI
jgi:hypothetical protein